ncbi:MAG: hypothetical protein ACRDGM_16600, partial [bacterium]
FTSPSGPRAYVTLIEGPGSSGTPTTNGVYVIQCDSAMTCSSAQVGSNNQKFLYQSLSIPEINADSDPLVVLTQRSTSDPQDIVVLDLSLQKYSPCS